MRLIGLIAWSFSRSGSTFLQLRLDLKRTRRLAATHRAEYGQRQDTVRVAYPCSTILSEMSSHCIVQFSLYLHNVSHTLKSVAPRALSCHFTPTASPFHDFSKPTKSITMYTQFTLDVQVPEFHISPKSSSTVPIHTQPDRVQQPPHLETFSQCIEKFCLDLFFQFNRSKCLSNCHVLISREAMSRTCWMQHN